MSRPPATNRAPTKDMYWFAHGGIETSSDKCLNQKEGDEENSDSASPTLRSWTDRRALPDDPKSQAHSNTAVDSCSSSGPSSLEMKEERNRLLEKRLAAEERRKQLWEAEQERNDAVLKKHLEREAALEARRNAQRSNIAFAFGSSVPRNVESLAGGDAEKTNRLSNASGLLQKGEDIMSKSMTAAVPAQRGRRKNDLMPVVHYERIPAPKAASSSSTRKRSVSMTRLDQLARPRKHYVEANKANSTVSSGNSSMLKDTIKSPTRPLSSASEQSAGSGRLGTSAIRRVRSSPRKPRPVSIAGTVPDHKIETKISPVKKTFKKIDVKKEASVTSKQSVEKQKSTHRVPSTSKPVKQVTSTPKPTKQPPQPKTSSPKTTSAKKTVTNKKKADIMVASQTSAEPSPTPQQESSSPLDSTPLDSAEAEPNNAKRIISEEEARAALAEKRRLAREQAEKEAELERQKQEELRKEEEERLRLEEEEQKQMEEEQLHLLEQHRQGEEEKLRKAIEENERKEEEERLKREEEQRLKVEQEKKAQEEAEKQRIELEEKLRKEEEERAERKKRLEKIMSRTRGKTTGSSPSGSVSGSDQLDSSENPQENLSSGANSLDSNGPAEIQSGPTSLEGPQEISEAISDGASMEAHPTYEVASDNESLHDIVMPKSETASQDNSLVILPDDFKAPNIESLIESSVDDDPPVSEAPQSDIVLNVDTSTFAAEEASNELSENIKSVSELSDNIDQVSVISINENTENISDVKVEEVNEVEVQEIIPKSEAPLLETMPVPSSFGSERDGVDHSEIILSFEDANDAASESTNIFLPDAPPAENIGVEAGVEQNTHSCSSDIKLPDPIYETTSDEGSVSSERHIDNSSYAFQEENLHHESQLITDEVFNEKEVAHSEETNFNPFEQQNLGSSSNPMAAYESQFEVGGMQDNIYAYETSDAPLPDVLEQPKESGEENAYPSPSSTSNLPDSIIEFNSKADADFLNFEENKVNVEEAVTFQDSNPFSVGAKEANAFIDIENLPAQTLDNFPLVENSNLPEQINYENQSNFSELSENFESSNVTIIKAEGSDECIGIISSVDHDHISNDYAKQKNIQSEQLKSNFEYASITDSEESSLDSNLSQVMTGEGDEKDSVVPVNGSSESTFPLKHEPALNPFSEPAVNGNSDSKSNGDHFYSETETLKNGHRLESFAVDQIGDFVQLVDSNHISSVDHSTSNIFDNVDAVNFGKMSPDPFLAKGNSNQISGNPFLLQDDQKQVLMTPDFFN